MAIRPKKQTSSNRGETGGGAPRGGSGNAGRVRPGMGDKPGSRSVKVSSSVTVRAKKGSPLKPSPGAEQARAQNARVLSKTTKAEAKANARGLKGANAPAKAKTVKMDNISKTATRIFGQTTTKGKPKSVKVGSKKEARLTAKETWAKNFEAKSDAKYEAQRALEAKKALIRARKYQ